MSGRSSSASMVGEVMARPAGATPRAGSGDRRRSPASTPRRTPQPSSQQPGRRLDAVVGRPTGRSRRRSSVRSGVGRRYRSARCVVLPATPTSQLWCWMARSRRRRRGTRRGRGRAGPRRRSGTSPCPVAVSPSTSSSYAGKHGLKAPMSREWSRYARPSPSASGPDREARRRPAPARPGRARPRPASRSAARPVGRRPPWTGPAR